VPVDIKTSKSDGFYQIEDRITGVNVNEFISRGSEEDAEKKFIERL
jgi:hypothetical protein